MTKRINISDLKEGMVIIKVTAQNGPVKIKKSGLVNSRDMINALTEMGVQEVEVDPDMTVEIKKPKITKSKTQQWLEDTGNYAQQSDQGISEQFNRSLFLPTVQELPEAWQYYGKKVGIVVTVVVGGFCIGLVGANLTSWVQQLSQPKVEVTQQTPADTAMPPASQSNSSTIAPAPETSAPASTQSNPLVTNPVSSAPNEKEVDALPEQQAPQELVLGVPLEEREANLANQADNVEAQTVIPPDLIKRFQDAMTALGDTQPQDPAVDVQPIKNVPPVTELPAWVLTQLPSISFSAHLYASEPEERWVRVNGRRITEGQEIEEGLRVVGIEPQHVIMVFKGQEFSMDALSDW
ncbi:general secretion pathway protein GspB [Aliiglaciecola sp. M165]|uniref:general secretion pathway protein GspB n=1 Tax=Aliiglaciecola sp. M165 TaxID=2593649 RepID=UPI0011805A98|nr:general secretion pathway protein GspB [Aliiglaciecola sp. M165]TRY31826.1 DUF3391 domain-containing protein [Aliiglaciecola sp. M165]